MKTLNLILLFRKLLLCQDKNLTVRIVPQLTKKFNCFPASDFSETPFVNPPFPGMVSCFTLLYQRICTLQFNLSLLDAQDLDGSVRLFENSKSSFLMLLRLSGRFSTSTGDKPIPDSLPGNFLSKSRSQISQLIFSSIFRWHSDADRSSRKTVSNDQGNVKRRFINAPERKGSIRQQNLGWKYWFLSI